MTPATSARKAPSPGASGLRLNVLPAVFPEGIQKDAVQSVLYSDDYWEKVKGWSDHGHEFHCYRSRDRIYVWPHSGRPLPKALILSSAVKHLTQDLPARVVARAVREAVVDRLIDHHGFEHVGGGGIDQVRLVLRTKNVAAEALEPLASSLGKELSADAGTFPYVAVQAMPLERWSEPVPDTSRSCCAET